METTNTLLEKMAWLYQQGFEPDMWKETGCLESEDLFLASKECYCPIWDSVGLDFKAPYFTESCLWSLTRRHLTPLTLLCLQQRDNLHEELLDIVIDGVKEGHLKAEVKE